MLKLEMDCSLNQRRDAQGRKMDDVAGAACVEYFGHVPRSYLNTNDIFK